MTHVNFRYQPLCRNRDAALMTADQLAAFADGYNTACANLGLDCGVREKSADKFAHAISEASAPAASDVEWIRSYVAERLAKLRERCEIDERMKQRLAAATTSQSTQST